MRGSPWPWYGELEHFTVDELQVWIPVHGSPTSLPTASRYRSCCGAHSDTLGSAEKEAEQACQDDRERHGDQRGDRGDLHVLLLISSPRKSQCSGLHTDAVSRADNRVASMLVGRSTNRDEHSGDEHPSERMRRRRNGLHSFEPDPQSRQHQRERERNEPRNKLPHNSGAVVVQLLRYSHHNATASPCCNPTPVGTSPSTGHRSCCPGNKVSAFAVSLLATRRSHDAR